MFIFFQNLKISIKLLISVLLASLVIFSAAISYIAYNSRVNTLNDAKKLADSYAAEFANAVHADMNVDIGICRTMANTFIGYKSVPPQIRMGIYKIMLTNIIKDNSQFISVWMHWELAALDSTYKKPYGRVRYTFYKENTAIKFRQDTMNLNGDQINSLYYKIKIGKQETITEPYFYSYTKKKEDEILESSICVPILHNDKFIGLAGLDVSLTRFQDMIKKIKPFKEGYAFLTANNGVFVAHPNDELLGQSVAELEPGNEKQFKITEKIKSGTAFSYITQDFQDGRKKYFSYAALKIGKSELPWTFGIAVPLDVITYEANRSTLIALMAGLLGIIFLTILIWFIARNISKPIIITVQKLKILTETGALNNIGDINTNRRDEIGEMNNAVVSLIQSLNHTATFAREIGKGNLEAEYAPLSKDDILGNSLLEMRKSLQNAKAEEEKRKHEDEKNNWITEGLAKFADILRQNNDNLELLSYDVIKNLVKYLNANQGGLFLLNNDDADAQFLQLTACFAYDRQKFLQKNIEIKEGLVGACFLEKQTIYLTEIPDEYLTIQSGLGNANPRCLLLVPLRLNDKVFGVIELASLEILEKFEVNFVEEVAESIASTISSVKTNIQTAELLEQSQQQSEEMRAQEEEMRQNMEELHATQEEILRKTAETESIMKGISNTLAIIEYDLDATIINSNDVFFDISGLQASELRGLKHKDLLTPAYVDSGEYDNLWEQLRNGMYCNGKFEHFIKNKSFWTQETLAPIRDGNGIITKVMAFINDITEQKNLEIQLATQLKEFKENDEVLRFELQKTSKQLQSVQTANDLLEIWQTTLQQNIMIMEFDNTGALTEVNDIYLKTFNLDESVLIGTKYSDLPDIPIDEKYKFLQFFEGVNKGFMQGTSHKCAINNQTETITECLIPLKLADDKIAKIIRLAFVVTENPK